MSSESKESPFEYPVKFIRPFEFEGETYDGITLDFTGLTGGDMERVMKDWQSEGNFSFVATLDPVFCRKLAELAAGKPQEFFQALPPSDYLRVNQQVISFLST